MVIKMCILDENGSIKTFPEVKNVVETNSLEEAVMDYKNYLTDKKGFRYEENAACVSKNGQQYIIKIEDDKKVFVLFRDLRDDSPSHSDVRFLGVFTTLENVRRFIQGHEHSHKKYRYWCEYVTLDRTQFWQGNQSFEV